MAWIQQTGWKARILEYAQTKNCHIGGLCGGFQMLCKKIVDSRSIEGLGLLDGETIIGREKILLNEVTATWKPWGAKVSGYEIHMGVTTHKNNLTVLATSSHNPKSLGFNPPSDLGLQNESGNIWGTYIHGLFDELHFRNKFLASLAVEENDYSSTSQCDNFKAWKDNQYDLLADFYEKHIDFSKLGL